MPSEQTADLGRAGAGRKCRIERVDIEAQIGRGVADHFADTFGGDLRATLMHRLGEQDRDSAANGPIVHCAVHWRANTDLNGAARIDQTLLDRMEKRRAVPEAQPEALGPGIDMGVEMDERQRAGAHRQRSQQGKGDRMIPAERDEMVDWPRLRLDRRQRTLDIPVRDPEVADIGDLAVVRRTAGDRVVAIDQHATGLPNRGRAETRAGTVRGAKVIRNPGDADRRARVAAPESEKARARCKSRYGSHVLNMVRPPSAAASQGWLEQWASPTFAPAADL